VADDCIEPYRDCVRRRQERVRRAIEEHPDLPNRRIAEIAGVSPRAVNNHKKTLEDASSTETAVELKDLYRPDIDYLEHRGVKLFQSAMWQCSLADMAFIWDKLVPDFERELFNRILKRRRPTHDRIKQKLRENGAAEADTVADD